MFLKDAIWYIIMIIVLIWSGVFLNYVKWYNTKLKLDIEQKQNTQENLQNKIDSILKWKDISKLNDSFNKLTNYFWERKKLTKLELFIFLEFVYPRDNFVKSLIIKENNIKLDFYTTSLEDIRKLNKNLSFLVSKNIVLTYKISTIKWQSKVIFKQWKKILNKYYSLNFELNPNYDLIRKFILSRNKQLKIPFNKYYILLKKDMLDILNKKNNTTDVKKNK